MLATALRTWEANREMVPDTALLLSNTLYYYNITIYGQLLVLHSRSVYFKSKIINIINIIYIIINNNNNKIILRLMVPRILYNK